MNRSNKVVRRKIIKQIHKWLTCLGLRWWRVDIYYHAKKKDIRKYFNGKHGEVTNAKVFADWRYGKASIHFNLPSFTYVSDDELEMIVIHELVHILVNEMRERGIDHEERVVTGLTKAFKWTREAQG